MMWFLKRFINDQWGATSLRLGLGLGNFTSGSGFGGNPTSEAITDESGNGLTDESGNALSDSGA